jgi:hypothetical protein
MWHTADKEALTVQKTEQATQHGFILIRQDNSGLRPASMVGFGLCNTRPRTMHAKQSMLCGEAGAGFGQETPPREWWTQQGSAMSHCMGLVATLIVHEYL